MIDYYETEQGKKEIAEAFEREFNEAFNDAERMILNKLMQQQYGEGKTYKSAAEGRTAAYAMIYTLIRKARNK